MSIRSYISVGSNVGNLVHNIHRACRLLQCDHTRIVTTSYLYRTAPMYVEDQPTYLNCALQISTTLQPTQLLKHLKSIEQQMGRVHTVRYAERVIDLDIVDYNNTIYIDDMLSIPHPRVYERTFVLQPLCDINADLLLPTRQITVSAALKQLIQSTPIAQNSIQRVFPLGNFNALQTTYQLLSLQHRTSYIMGILNVTDDSFSDGGMYNTVERAIVHCDQLVRDGADIIDIGAESTRPGSTPYSSEHELQRILPIIDAVRERHPTVPLSVDTYHANTAHIVSQHHVQLINDISAGTVDRGMHSIVAESQLAYCGMHMRGTPSTMTQPQYTKYKHIINDVNTELHTSILHGMNAGIYRWNILADPGIGFAKTSTQSIQLLANIQRFAPIHAIPILVGASRKRFIAHAIATQRQHRLNTESVEMLDRIDGTLATVAHCIHHNVQFIRVHDVKQVRNMIDVLNEIHENTII